MTRHHKLAALAVLALGLAFVGLGAREDNPTDPEPAMCTTDLKAVFDWCAPSSRHFPCKFVPEQYADACQAGCVKRLCPEQVSCTGLDPMWCAPCTDNQGALYWANLADAQAHCEDVMERSGVTAWDDCRRAFVKERCPAWDGRWSGQKDGARIE
jgi:hypothetical protein